MISPATVTTLLEWSIFSRLFGIQYICSPLCELALFYVFLFLLLLLVYECVLMCCSNVLRLIGVIHEFLVLFCVFLCHAYTHTHLIQPFNSYKIVLTIFFSSLLLLSFFFLSHSICDIDFIFYSIFCNGIEWC